MRAVSAAAHRRTGSERTSTDAASGSAPISANSAHRMRATSRLKSSRRLRLWPRSSAIAGYLCSLTVDTMRHGIPCQVKLSSERAVSHHLVTLFEGIAQNLTRLALDDR